MDIWLLTEVTVLIWLYEISPVKSNQLEYFRPKESNPAQLNEFLENVLAHQADFQFVRETARRFHKIKKDIEEPGLDPLDEAYENMDETSWRDTAKRHVHNYHNVNKRFRSYGPMKPKLHPNSQYRLRRRAKKQVAPQDIRIESVGENGEVPIEEGDKYPFKEERQAMDLTDSLMHKTYTKNNNNAAKKMNNRREQNDNYYYVDLENNAIREQAKYDNDQKFHEMPINMNRRPSASSGDIMDYPNHRPHPPTDDLPFEPAESFELEPKDSNEDFNNPDGNSLLSVDQGRPGSIVPLAQAPGADYEGGSRLEDYEYELPRQRYQQLKKYHQQLQDERTKFSQLQGVKKLTQNPGSHFYQQPHNAPANVQNLQLLPNDKVVLNPASSGGEAKVSTKLFDSSTPKSKFLQSKIDSSLVKNEEESLNGKKVQKFGNGFIEISKNQKRESHQEAEEDEEEAAQVEPSGILQKHSLHPLRLREVDDEDVNKITFRGRKLQFIDEEMANSIVSKSEYNEDVDSAPLRARRDFLQALGMKNEDDYSEDNVHKQDMCVNNTDVKNDTTLTTKKHCGGCSHTTHSCGSLDHDAEESTTLSHQKDDVNNIKQILEEPKEILADSTFDSGLNFVGEDEKLEDSLPIDTNNLDEFKIKRKARLVKLADFDDVLENANEVATERLTRDIANNLESKVMSNKDKILEPNLAVDQEEKKVEERAENEILQKANEGKREIPLPALKEKVNETPGLTTKDEDKREDANVKQGDQESKEQKREGLQSNEILKHKYQADLKSQDSKSDNAVNSDEINEEQKRQIAGLAEDLNKFYENEQTRAARRLTKFSVDDLIPSLNLKQPSNLESDKKDDKYNDLVITTRSIITTTDKTATTRNCNTTSSSSYEKIAEQMDMENEKLAQVVNGQLACKIVTNVYDEVKRKTCLKAKFFSGLSRKHMGFPDTDFDIFKTNDTEDADEAKLLLDKMTKVLNRLVLNQVRRRLCQRLPEEMKDYLDNLLNVKNNAQGNNFEPNTNQGSFLFKYDENVKPPFDMKKIQETLVTLEGLLLSYQNMNSECQGRAAPVKNYIENHVKMLRKLVSCPRPPCGAEMKGNDFKRDTPQYHGGLIEKQLESVGLGRNREFVPSFDINKLIQSKIRPYKTTSKRDIPIGGYSDKFTKLQRAIEQVREKRENARKMSEMFGDLDDKASSKFVVDDYEQPFYLD